MYKKHNYYKTSAICVTVAEIWIHTEDSSSYGRKGTFKYEYDNQYFCEQEKTYLSSKKLNIGDKVDIYVNPKTPNLFITENNIKRLIAIGIIGIITMLIAILIT